MPERNEVWAEVPGKLLHGTYSVSGEWVEVIADDGRYKSDAIGDSSAEEVARRLLSDLFQPAVTPSITEHRAERRKTRTRTIFDKSGAVWQAAEEIVVVFSGPEGRTVTAEPTARRLRSMAHDDVLKLLEQTLADLDKKSKQQRGGSY